MAGIPSFNFIAGFCLFWIFAEWTRRIFWMKRLARLNPPLEARPLPESAPAPKISVIIPARNEEANIENCLTHLFAQQYRDFEILVVDDRSTDRTPEILNRLSAKSPVPFQILRIEKLPPDWTGKTHAITAGARAARGSWLLFTDADTTHGPLSLASSIQTALEQKIDFLTLAPETECRSFWEKTIQPLAVSSLAFWFQTDRLNDDRAPILANGQFLLMSRALHDAIGGNESVRHEVVEDVALARRARQAGYRVRFLNGTRLYKTRMYSSLAQIRRGWTRIFTYLFDKKILSVLHKVFLILFFSLAPFMVLALEAFWRGSSDAAYSASVLAGSAVVCAFILLIRWNGNRMAKTDPKYGLLHPLASLVMVWILLECVYRIAFRRPSEWKGQLHR